MATKQEVADYINDVDKGEIWNDNELAYVQSKLDENLVKLLENFNNTSAPSNKITGQLWYDQTNNQLNVYTGSKFKPVGSTTNSATAPTNAVQGDMWLDTSNTQLYVYSGTAWTLIGPTTVAGSGVTQVITETPEDDTGLTKTILKLVVNDSVVGVVSNVAFTPSSTETFGAALISAGFSTVAQGIQLSSTVASAKFRGTATDSDALGGVAAANYLRANANDTTTGTLGVINDDGITIGTGSDATLSMNSDDFEITNTTLNKDIVFKVNDGGTSTEALRIQGSTGRIENLRVGNLTVDGTNTVMNTTTLSVEDNIIELNRNISNNAGMPSFSGLTEVKHHQQQNRTCFGFGMKHLQTMVQLCLEMQAGPGQHSNQVAVRRCQPQHWLISEGM